MRSILTPGSAIGLTMPGSDVEVTSLYFAAFGDRKKRTSLPFKSTTQNSGIPCNA